MSLESCIRKAGKALGKEDADAIRVSPPETGDRRLHQEVHPVWLAGYREAHELEVQREQAELGEQSVGDRDLHLVLVVVEVHQKQSVQFDAVSELDWSDQFHIVVGHGARF